MGILVFLTTLALAWGSILPIITCRYDFLIGKRRYLRTRHDCWNHRRNRFLHTSNSRSNNNTNQSQNQEEIDLRDLSNHGDSDEQA